MKKFLFAALLAVPTAVSANASDHRAPNGAIASPQASGEILVYSPRSSSAQYYWCGAAHYVINKANVPSNSRIYLTEGRQRINGRTTVTFSLTPPAGGGG